MTAIREGFGRVLRAPRLILALWLLGFLVALPGAWEVTARIQDSAGRSRAQENLRSGFDMGWHGDFQRDATGTAASFTPTVAGAGAFYINLEAWVTGTLLDQPPLVLGLGVLSLLLWLLIQGGVVDRLARDDAHRGAAHLLATGGRFFFRFLRLFLTSAAVYYLVYLVSRWAYGRVGAITRDVPAERPVLLLSLAVVAVTALALALVQMSFTYAKIATVVEDRRSMLLAALHGLRFTLRNLVGTLFLLATVAAVAVLLLALYAAGAPVAGPSSTAGVAAGFALGQAYLMAKIALRLWLLAGQASLHGRRQPAPATLAA